MKLDKSALQAKAANAVARRGVKLTEVETVREVIEAHSAKGLTRYANGMHPDVAAAIGKELDVEPRYEGAGVYSFDWTPPPPPPPVEPEPETGVVPANE